MRNTNPERTLFGDADDPEPVQAQQDDRRGGTGGYGDRTSAALIALARLMGTVAARGQFAEAPREEGGRDDP